MVGLTPKIVDAVTGLFFANLRGSCFVEYLNLCNIFPKIEIGFFRINVSDSHPCVNGGCAR